jgi:glycerol kinase
VLYQKEGEKPVYALEGSIECGAQNINWVRATFKDFDNDITVMNKRVNERAQEEPNSSVLFLPSFSGIMSPYWTNTPSCLVGLTGYTDAVSVYRACLDGIAFRVNDCLQSFSESVDVIFFLFQKLDSKNGGGRWGESEQLSDAIAIKYHESRYQCL